MCNFLRITCKNYIVKDYQSIPVVVNENVSVYDAIVTMFLEDVGTLFVVDSDSNLVGVSITERFIKSKYW